LAVVPQPSSLALLAVVGRQHFDCWDPTLSRLTHFRSSTCQGAALERWWMDVQEIGRTRKRDRDVASPSRRRGSCRSYDRHASNDGAELGTRPASSSSARDSARLSAPFLAMSPRDSSPFADADKSDRLGTNRRFAITVGASVFGG